MDEMMEKMVYPCEAAADEEFQQIFGKAASFGADKDIARLRQFTWPIPSDRIPWRSLEMLCVLGDVFDDRNTAFEEAGFEPGAYINYNGSALVLIHQAEAELQACLARRDMGLKTLLVYSTAFRSLDCTNLTFLENLGVFFNPELSRIEGLAQMRRLETMILFYCARLTHLPPLDALKQLTELHLFQCESLTQLPPLDALTQLAKLNLAACKNLTQLPPLDALTQLTALVLSGCTSLTQLPPLDALTQLTELNLFGCESLTQLPPLDALTQLTALVLSGCTSLTQLPPLDALTQLAKLNLGACKNLTQLPPLDALTQLTELDLRGCTSLTQLPPLDALTQMTRLDLSGCNSLTQLPSLDALTQLGYLNLSYCKGLRELPDGIRSMKVLRQLDLRDMMLRTLPDWLPEIAEEFTLDFPWKVGEEKATVSLYDTTVDDIPDMSIFEQPYEVVAEWFRNRSLGRMRSLNEIKVVFLGDGEAGKSHTIARLMNDGGEPVGYVDSSTPGIVIKNKDYTVEGRRFQVHYWDFGGQEIMHSMHRIFLTGRTMYVVLLNARDDTQGDRAKYWLHNIKSFAPDSPVLLVLNKIDQNENASVDEPDLRSRYGKLTQVVRLSAKCFTQEQFNDRFTKVLLAQILKTGFLDAEWPDSWTRVKERLEHMESHFIMGSDYQGICAECQVDRNQKDLLHWFNDLGVSFCYDGEKDYELEDYVILRPDWITNALYIILFNRLEGARNGLIPHRAIYDILKSAHRNPDIRCTLPEAKYDSSEIGYVLGVMRKFSLSFPEGERHEFIPMLCQQNSTVNVQKYREDADVLEFNMEFDYLPNNLLHRLMVERHSELDMDNVWRTGARFVLPEPGYSAVVVIDGNTLRFFIRHSDPMHRKNTYLTMLKANVERIVREMGLKEPVCKLVYKLDGRQDEFEYEMLKGMRSIGQTLAYSMQWRKMISIEDILNQSAPEGLEDERKLLEAIRKACLQMMAEPDYRLTPGETGWGMEDKRNRRVRDALEDRGYVVHDQTQRGLSGTRRGIGEPDLLLMNDRKEPWTIIEALRVSGVRMPEWKSHLDKLVENYNYFGAPCLYLLTYVDTDETRFKDIWESYLGHISGYGPGKFTFVDGSLAVLDQADSPRNVKTAACQYTCGGQRTTAYHIFAQIPTRRE